MTTTTTIKSRLKNEFEQEFPEAISPDYLLCDACSTGNLEQVINLLTDYHEIIDIDALGGFSLKVACQKGFAEIVKVLLKHTSRLHPVYSEELGIAVKNNHKNIVKALLKSRGIIDNNYIKRLLNSGKILQNSEIYSLLSKKYPEEVKDTNTAPNYSSRIKQVIGLYTGEEKLQEFLDLLHDTGSYISGSMLLTLDSNSDLDIFTTSIRKDKIVDFIYKLGFKEHEPEFDTKEDYRGLDIFSEKKYYKGNGKAPLTIDLIVCHDPLKTISAFDLTCCMNWFNGKEIYYLDTTAETDNALFAKYPIKNKPITPTPKEPQISLYNLASKKTYKMEYRVAKYENRGFEIIQVHSETLFNPKIMYNIISKNA